MSDMLNTAEVASEMYISTNTALARVMVLDGHVEPSAGLAAGAVSGRGAASCTPAVGLMGRRACGLRTALDRDVGDHDGDDDEWAVAIPALDVRSSVMTVADSGSLRIDTAVAAISTATAGVSEKPGRCAASRPPAAPMNKAGNVGPPAMFLHLLQLTPRGGYAPRDLRQEWRCANVENSFND